MTLPRTFLTVCLLMLAACIHMQPAEPQPSREEIAAKLQKIYDDGFIGKPREVIIAYFGGPTYKGTLDNGMKFIAYRAKRRMVYSGTKQTSLCTMRFWLKNDRVAKVETVGDEGICAQFVGSRERSGTVYPR